MYDTFIINVLVKLTQNIIINTNKCLTYGLQNCKYNNLHFSPLKLNYKILIALICLDIIHTAIKNIDG